MLMWCNPEAAGRLIIKRLRHAITYNRRAIWLRLDVPCNLQAHGGVLDCIPRGLPARIAMYKADRVFPRK